MVYGNRTLPHAEVNLRAAPALASPDRQRLYRPAADRDPLPDGDRLGSDDVLKASCPPARSRQRRMGSSGGEHYASPRLHRGQNHADIELVQAAGIRVRNFAQGRNAPPPFRDLPHSLSKFLLRSQHVLPTTLNYCMNSNRRIKLHLSLSTSMKLNPVLEGKGPGPT